MILTGFKKNLLIVLGLLAVAILIFWVLGWLWSAKNSSPNPVDRPAEQTDSTDLVIAEQLTSIRGKIKDITGETLQLETADGLMVVNVSSATVIARKTVKGERVSFDFIKFSELNPSAVVTVYPGVGAANPKAIQADRIELETTITK